MRNIIVTGGLGFIGFNFIQYIMENFEDINIINIDKRTYAAQYKLDEKLKYFDEYSDRILDYTIDINNFNVIDGLIQEYEVEGIINFAAESHVDFSINNPSIFVQSNINGVETLLELANKHHLRFHQVSTDEVYGSINPSVDVVREDFKLNPSSTYSASKASADLLVLANYKTYGSAVTISRTVNNYGPYQDPSKLIPKAITLFNNDEQIGIYGTGKNIRNWLYVLDHCIGIWKIYNTGMYGEIFNIGAADLIDNNTIVKTIARLMKKPMTLIKYITDRPGHDFAYHLNSDKIARVLNWQQTVDFTSGIQYTVDFYSSK